MTDADLDLIETKRLVEAIERRMRGRGIVALALAFNHNTKDGEGFMPYFAYTADTPKNRNRAAYLTGYMLAAIIDPDGLRPGWKDIEDE